MKPFDFKQNITTIEKYKTYLSLQGLTYATIYNKIRRVVPFLRFTGCKHIIDINRSDIENFFVFDKGKIKEKKLKSVTYNKHMSELKCFFNWCKPNNDFFEIIKEVEEKQDTSDKDYICEEDVFKMISMCSDPRDRALIALLWNTAARISELLDANVDSIDIEKEQITVNGKTGERTIPLTTSLVIVRDWLNYYKGTPTDPLFPSYENGNKGDRLKRAGATHIVSQIVKASGICGKGKKTNIHSFRHGRLTELADSGVTEMMLRLYAGWTRSSNTPEIYINTKQRDMISKIRQVDGHETKVEPPKPKNLLKSKKCWKCGEENAFDLQYCKKCNSIINEKLRLQKQEEEKAEQERIRQANMNDMMKHMDSIVEDRIKQMFASALKGAPTNIDEIAKKESDVWE